MSGPKHLWSGDWRNQTAATEPVERAEPPELPEPPGSSEAPQPTEAPERPPLGHRRPGSRRALPIALAAVVLLAGGAFALTNLGGTTRHEALPSATQPSATQPPATQSPAPSPAPTPTPPTTPTPTPASSTSPPLYWLGMQLETVPPGAAAIATVRQGSPADLAGLSPGDAIVQLNNRPITGTEAISDAIHGLHAGDRVAMRISHGSALFTAVVTLAAPVEHPVTFSEPLVLIGLLAIPLLIWWYVGQQRRRVQAAHAFVAAPLIASVTPRRPGWRRHAPMLVLAIAMAVLIVAAARPQRTVAVPIDGGAIMLANDVSNSMTATDVRPSRLAAAQQAAERFLAQIPSSILAGQIQFARHPILLQSPTADRSLTKNAIAELRPGGGGTAIGDTITTALKALTSLPAKDGRRPPGAIVLLSDGTSNVGTNPLTAARRAKADHIPIYTIALGTPNGTIPIKRGGKTVNAPVPVSPQQLKDIALASGGRAYTAANSANASAVYAHLAKQLGHKRVKQELTAGFAGGALALVLVGGVLSLVWFGRLP